MAPHGARPGNEDARALSFLVQDAGTPGVNGVYVRTGTQNQGVDVFAKKGSSYALFRRKENHWSLADLGGGSPDRWNLRCVELYRCDRVPGGFVPPDFGWKVVDGRTPCPFIVGAKNPNVRLTLPRMEESKSSPTLSPRKPLGRSTSAGAVFGNARKDEITKQRSAPVGSAMPLFASSHAALTSGLAMQGTAGHVNFILCYSVVLTRPSNRVHWGCKWNVDSFQDSGSRDLELIEDGSPFARWNTWQSIRGRPDACVFPGDRLVKVDGRWAYFEQEIGQDEHEVEDPSHSLQRRVNTSTITVQSAFDGSKAGKPCNNAVFDFARRGVLRPMPPGPPKVTVPESEALLEVSWSPLAWHPGQVAWAVIVQDVAVRMWYTVDAAGTARSVQLGCDVGGIAGDMNFVTVLKGLTQGRTYAACVAVYTERGWSAFSALSRAVTLTAQLSISDVLLEDFEHPAHAIDPDAWPERNRYVVPIRVIPGATTPVNVVPGPNTFMASRRRLHMQVLCPTLEGLELTAVDFICEVSRETMEESVGLVTKKISRKGRGADWLPCLVVTNVTPNGLVDAWNRANAQLPEVQVRRGDRIMAVNSVRSDPDNMEKALREAFIVRLTIVRGPPPRPHCADCGNEFEGTESFCQHTNCPMRGSAKRPKDASHSVEDEDRQVLQLQNIRQDTPGARWVREMEAEPSNFHGAEVGKGLRVGDKIIRLNGVCGAAKMVAEIQRRPNAFALIVERSLGHDLEGTDAAITLMKDDLKVVRDMLISRGDIKLKRLNMEMPGHCNMPGCKRESASGMHNSPCCRLCDSSKGRQHEDKCSAMFSLEEKKQQIKQLKQQHMIEVGEEWQFIPNREDIFEVDQQLDGQAVKLAEEVQFSCLLPPDEGELALAIVGSEMEQLEICLEAVLRLAGEATIAAGNRPPRFTYPSLVNDAEARVLLFDRRAKADTDRALMIASTVMNKRMSFSGEPPEMEDAALTALKSALVDVRCDPRELRGAIQLFDKASPAVKASPAAKKMLRRADTLEKLWIWHENFETAKQNLFFCVDGALAVEKTRMDNDSDSEDEEGTKPYDIEHLEKVIEEAQEFATEMQHELVEAAEIKARQTAENSRQAAKKNLHTVLADPREDKATLEEALGVCKQADVHDAIIKAGFDMLQFWGRKHKRDKAREAIGKACASLKVKLNQRDKPGAGSDEQRIVREALEEAHLDPNDELNISANDLLAQWKTANSVLRAEAKLHSAVKRATGGWKHSEPKAGDLLGSAIAQVATEGVDYQRLEQARETLTLWEYSRKKKAESELDIAMQYGDVEHLKEAIAFARNAGFDEDDVKPAVARLERLRYQEEINTMLNDAMDNKDMELMEKCVAYAHDKKFVESENTLLCSASMQLKLRFWTEEFRLAVKSRCADGLVEDVEHVTEIVEECDMLLGPQGKTKGLETEPEIATKCLKVELRALNLLLPSARDMAGVHLAEKELERVLGAVEKLAADLPAAIEEGYRQVGAGSSKTQELLKDAVAAKKAYDRATGDLEKAIDVALKEDTADELKNCLIKAFLAGAPQKLVKRAWKLLETRFEAVEKFAQTELELHVALAEADDVEDVTVESRFLRLQNAADEAKKLVPVLIPEIWAKVDETCIALAAERTLVMTIADSEIILSGLRPDTAASGGGGGGDSPTRSPKKGQEDETPKSRARSATDGAMSEKDKAKKPSGAVSAEQVEKVAELLGNACMSADMSALDEAKKLIPVAEALRARLYAEAKSRFEARAAVEKQKGNKNGSTQDLRLAIIGAREVSVPGHMLENAYEQLRDMKVAFLVEDLNAARARGERTLAIACWFRAKALQFEGLPASQKDATLAEIAGPGGVADIVTVRSMMSGSRCGGSFGTATWRQNPQFCIRFAAGEAAKRKTGGGGKSALAGPTSMPTIDCTVAIAEGSDMPSTLSVHVVRNNEEATEAGCRWLLAPGYEILGASEITQDLPICNFSLPPSDDKRPVFIIPSAAKGETGPFTVIVEGSAPVDVVEVDDKHRDRWDYQVDKDVEWADEMPFRKNMGGGRTKAVAPSLAWYRNPQFRVRLKSKAQMEKDKLEALAAAGTPSPLVAEFGFAPAAPEPNDPEDNASERAATSTIVSTLESSKHEMVHIRVVVAAASNFTDCDWIETTDIFCTCAIQGRRIDDLDGGYNGHTTAPDRILFRTQVTSGSISPTWNHAYVCKDFMTDDVLCFRVFRIVKKPETSAMDAETAPEEEEIGVVNLPFVQFRDGFEGAVGLLTKLAEITTLCHGLHERDARVASGFWGQLHLKAQQIEAVESTVEGTEGTASAAPSARGAATSSYPASSSSTQPAGMGGETAPAGMDSECKPPEEAAKPTLPLPKAKAVAGGTMSGFTLSDRSTVHTDSHAALLQVRMLPVDMHQEVECAVHIVKNNDISEKRINENPSNHALVASTGSKGSEYIIATEVGCVCKLLHGVEDEDEGDSVIVIPSLETKQHCGKFNLQFLSTEDIIVERVN